MGMKGKVEERCEIMSREWFLSLRGREFNRERTLNFEIFKRMRGGQDPHTHHSLQPVSLRWKMPRSINSSLFSTPSESSKSLTRGSGNSGFESMVFITPPKISTPF